MKGGMRVFILGFEGYLSAFGALHSSLFSKVLQLGNAMEALNNFPKDKKRLVSN